MGYSVDTYRDGGTVSIKSEKDNREYCINKMIGSEGVGAVYACYPTRGVPISGMPELVTAKRILTEALPHFRSPNEVIMIGTGLGWIQTQIYKIEDAEKTVG